MKFEVFRAALAHYYKRGYVVGVLLYLIYGVPGRLGIILGRSSEHNSLSQFPVDITSGCDISSCVPHKEFVSWRPDDMNVWRVP